MQKRNLRYHNSHDGYSRYTDGYPPTLDGYKSTACPSLP
jgi:hypothetical protein